MNTVRVPVLLVCAVVLHMAACAQDPVPPPPPPLLEMDGPDTTEVYDMAALEEQPRFPDGDDGLRHYLMKNIRYPDSAISQGLQGKVFIEFEIDTIGNVEHVRVNRGVAGAPMLEEEALRVVKAMPTWAPARMKGKPVRCRFILPISFTMSDDKKK